jgi:hypothetical protein
MVLTIVDADRFPSDHHSVAAIFIYFSRPRVYNKILCKVAQDIRSATLKDSNSKTNLFDFIFKTINNAKFDKKFKKHAQTEYN